MLQIIVVLLCVVTGSRQAVITEFDVPDDGVAAGDNATLICRHDFLNAEKVRIVKWWWKPLEEEGDKKELYQRVEGKAQVVTVKGWDFGSLSNSEDNLVIYNIQPFQSGTFECEVSAEDTGSEIRKAQDLVVYTPGSGTELNVTDIEDGEDEDTTEDIFIECSAYGVSPLPDLDIKIYGHSINASVSVSDLEDNLYDVKANATLSSLKPGSTVDCDLFFDVNITYPSFRATEIYQPSGSEESTTEADVEPTAIAVNQTDEEASDMQGGVSRVTFSALVLLTASQLLIFS